MSIDIRLPKIDGQTTEQQMAQTKSYLHQLAEQLNWALNTIGDAQAGNTSAVVWADRSESEPETDIDAENTFNAIKALIIKSADIVHAYEDTILTDFNGIYFAESDFGTFIETTKKTVEENSKYTNEVYTNVQKITNTEKTGTLDTLAEDVRTTNAYIKRGLLGYDKKTGDSVYGIAVGETDENGVYKQYAWFTSNKLSFFDGAGVEVAYISSNTLYITDAVFLGTVVFGKYKVDTSDGLAFLWIGG